MPSVNGPSLRWPRPGEPTLLVAELSANHGGSLERALACVHAAAAAGADAIKIQSYEADDLTIDCARAEFRIEHGPWGGQTLYELYRQARTPRDWFPVLQDAAAALGLPLFSTPFHPDTVDWLDQQGVCAFKVASFELVDHELLAAIAATGRPVVMSTGLADEAEIAAAVAVLRRGWQGHDPGLSLLHCVSAYPAPPAQMNLATIVHLERTFGVVPGLSDHSLGGTVATAAVALGARVLEKHLTLRRADGGPDSHFSMEPDEFARLVADVRIVERAVGTVSCGPQPADRGSLIYRRSLFVVRDVAAGAVFTRDNVRSIRPGHGLAPAHLPVVLGRRAARDCAAGTPIAWDLLA